LRQPLPAYLFVLDVTFFVQGELLFPLALGIGAERNISMPKQDIASRQFQRKISDFCELRIAPIAPKRVLENIRPYLISLVIYRKSPPLLNGRINWTMIGEICGIEDDMTPELKNHLRPGLDAILRWLRMPPAAEDVRQPKPKTRSPKPDRRAPAPTASSTRKPQRLGSNTPAQSASASPGPQPKPIQEFPEPLFEAADDPESFQDALVYQMRRFGDSYWQLYRAIIRLGENFDHKTLLSWILGERAPRSIASFDILSRIERRYRLRPGYFKAKLHPLAPWSRSWRYQSCRAAAIGLASAG
jgi:hypothetical protein